MSKSRSRSRSRSRTKKTALAPAPAKKGGSGRLRLRQPCWSLCGYKRLKPKDHHQRTRWGCNCQESWSLPRLPEAETRGLPPADQVRLYTRRLSLFCGFLGVLMRGQVGFSQLGWRVLSTARGWDRFRFSKTAETTRTSAYVWEVSLKGGMSCCWQKSLFGFPLGRTWAACSVRSCSATPVSSKTCCAISCWLTTLSSRMSTWSATFQPTSGKNMPSVISI